MAGVGNSIQDPGLYVDVNEDGLSIPRDAIPADMARNLIGLARARLGMVSGDVNLGTLALLVSVFHVDPRVASIPALLAGGVANFLGNRYFAFRAKGGSVAKQALGYTAVEIIALALNGVLYDTTLRMVPGAAHAYWAVRLVTSHVVFLCWSYPLWRRVFAVKELSPAAETAG